MVKTTDDVLDINPLERMDRLEEISIEKRGTIAAKKKELEELEKTKRIELEELDKKKRKEIEDLDKRKQRELDDLEKKRKELQDLEKKKLKEIEETESLIEKSFQDLMRHKRLLIQEDEEKVQKKKKSEGVNLEEVAESAPKIIPEGANISYSKFFENLQAPQRLYDVTNRGFYEGLTDLRNRAASGQITPEEERFVENLRTQFDKFNQNDDYRNKDQNQYVQRSLNIISQIDKYQRLKGD